MPDLYTTILGQTLQTYTVLNGIGIVISFFMVSLLLTRSRPAPVFDVGLAAVLVGLIVARAGHVLLNWQYFSVNQAEIAHISAGGLDWHGAVVGALLGGLVIVNIRRIPLHGLLDACALAVPVLAFFAWWGCGAAACAYGAEVENLYSYPFYLVGEYPDVYGLVLPRFNTQSLGMVACLILLILMSIVTYQNVLRGRRFWLSLALLSLIMFSIGFLRGDPNPMMSGLRVDQWLDLAFLLIACILLIIPWRHQVHAARAG